MKTQLQKQTGIWLPEDIIINLNKRAKSQGVSFNAYVQRVLTEDVKSDIPYINPNDEINPSILSMAGTIPIPSQEEFESDPRLADAFGVGTIKFAPDNVWFTSDTHFGHEKIIKYSGRPFANASEMNEELIRRWRETVPEDGIVFHLGDFAYGGSRQWNDILCALPGRKYLILGNHDLGCIRHGAMSRFEMVTHQLYIRVGGQEIILNHNPFLCYGGAYRDVWQLFGHVHSGPLSKTGLDLPRLKMLFPLQYDVGVDNNDFRPVSFAEVKAKIETQVEAAREASGLKDICGTGSGRRIVFLDPSIAPASSAQKAAFERLEAFASDIVEISVGKGESLKEAICWRVALLPGNVRFVYVGTQPLDDFRCVMVDRFTGITERDVETAIKILQ